MGSDNLHHKRKSRKAGNLTRRRFSRNPYDRVLVVCEGSKTEPNYLRELLDFLKLSNANVEVDGRSGSSPVSVVRHAKRRYLKEKNKGDAYDRVFCVFDKDSHASYAKAISESVIVRPDSAFQAVPSIPCFEYWLLLHFEFSTRPYSASGGTSACAHVIGDLRRYIPDYAKGDEGVFKKLMNETDRAIENSKRALGQAATSGTDNPTTKMHEVVEYLQHLKN